MPTKNGTSSYAVAAGLVLALLGLLTMDVAAFLYLLGWPSGWWFLLGLGAVVLGCAGSALVCRLTLHDDGKKS